MTGGRTELCDSSIYIREDSQDTFPALECDSLLSIVDGTLNALRVCNLDEEVLQDLMAEYPGLTPLDLKERSEYRSVTTMNA